MVLSAELLVDAAIKTPHRKLATEISEDDEFAQLRWCLICVVWGRREGSTDAAPGSVRGQEEMVLSPQASDLVGKLTSFRYFCAEFSVVRIGNQAIPDRAEGKHLASKRWVT